MKLHEYRAKDIFRSAGIPVPTGRFVPSGGVADAVREIGTPAVVKAQVLVGGRGKAGAIRIVHSPEEAEDFAAPLDRVKGVPVRGFLVEEWVEIDSEVYLGITVDREVGMPVIIASSDGGVDIEEVPDERIYRRHVDPLIGLRPFMVREVASFIGNQEVAPIVEALYHVFRSVDAELVEINPLAITHAGVVAVDAKVIVDSDALFRHPDLAEEEEELTPLERKAAEEGIAFIQLDGDIGVIANGAGLTMATLDSLHRHGGRGGVFLDLGGTDDPEKVKRALMLMYQARPRVVLINVFGGITKCDTVARGINAVVSDHGMRFPIVVRIRGRNEEEARVLLEAAGIHSCLTIEQAVCQAIELAGGV